MTVSTPEVKAAGAAEALAAEGVAVTARAVRERSGVRMAIAADAARSWNEREAEQREAPAIPEAVQARFDALWREAFTAARKEFDEAVAGWKAKLQRADEERDQLTVAVEEAEKECERIDTAAQAAAEQSAKDLADAQAKAAADLKEQASLLADERSRADKAEGALAAISAERDRLLNEVAELRKTRK
ncbi:replication region DNA-binding N-term [Nocardioides sp. YR527]|uniref:DNA-binding protein n=1 Tax=Nocardioides sp. YR527 TaxID=1881028 RepID=UPI00088503FF|nr:DNA-binding protein [Nocardioides sp. YR527]SDL34339.1 replication region DNA-binding N-term [Nocardioides sp. YR527]